MHPQIDKDPTEFFSVVGAPYVRERVDAGEYRHHENRFVGEYPRKPETGFAMVCAGLGAVLLGMSVFASSGAARLVEVAYQAVR